MPKDITLCSWGSGGAISPPAARPGQGPDGVKGSKPLKDLGILHFTVPR